VADIYKPWKTLLSDEDYLHVAKDISGRKCLAVGFSTWCHSFPDSILLVKELRKITSEIKTIFGGPQVSTLDYDTMVKFPEIDYILRGEADQSLPLLLRCILNDSDKNDLEKIPGLTYRDPSDKSKIICTTEPTFIKILDTLPIPSYEKITDENNLRLDAGRGCPFQCTFCSTNQFFARKYRVKSVGRIIMEMDDCQQKLGVNHVGLSHDTLTVDKKFTRELSAGINTFNCEREKPVFWTCSSRTDCVTEDLITGMCEGGCRAMFFGIESGSPRIQKKIRKNLDLEEAKRNVRHAIRIGIKVTVSYIAGFPDETEEDLEKTLKSILEMAMMGAEPQMALLSILPGTPLYAKYVDQLEYDGKTFGMTGSFLNKPVMDIIKTDHK
jgi:radical SAM superfamily enzyme YgiQ (UPF0313 family)